MCGVAEAAIGMGVLSMGTGIMQAQDEAAYANAVAQQKYQQAKAQAERNNQIATQQYNNRLRIAKQKDEIKKQDYEAQLKAQEAAVQASLDKSNLNAAEFNRASAEVGLKKRQLEIEAAFEVEEQLAEMIKTQGQLLSTGGSGQSFLMQSLDSERQFGRATERIGEVTFNQHQQLGLQQQGVSMDYLASEWANFNNVPGTPTSQRAGLSPYEPIKDMGPAAPIRRSASAGIASAVVGGIGAGLATGATLSGGAAMSTW